ncbi:uncharacterized protein LOC116587174 [Mustela erminea]|uniref:uncharacterized protein LOC116587174 n=1 Tax=Mustela erminea TaxID=36723 RepID=UPI0013868DCB|nr:uncharacterized protein LOC116587174 [Mustela erminea]
MRNSHVEESSEFRQCREYMLKYSLTLALEEDVHSPVPRAFGYVTLSVKRAFRKGAIEFLKVEFQRESYCLESLSEEVNHEEETKKETSGKPIVPPKCQKVKRYVLSIFPENKELSNRCWVIHILAGKVKRVEGHRGGVYDSVWKWHMSIPLIVQFRKLNHVVRIATSVVNKCNLVVCPGRKEIACTYCSIYKEHGLYKASYS